MSLQFFSKAIPRPRLRLPPTFPLQFARKLPSFCLKTGVLAISNSLLQEHHRWNLLQLLIIASTSGIPGIRFLRNLATPLLTTWIYGLVARIFAPAHRRSLKFWKKVLPIYVGYKSTQLQLKAVSARTDRRTKTWNKRHQWGAEKVYNLCVEMRGFYLKDGQFLGARSDLVPMAWCESLRRLQDRVPPVPFSQIEATIRDAYGINRTSQVFESIEATPLASATIAQVHRGEMPDGTAIALKAQYRDQERLCAMDLLNLKRLAQFLQKHDMNFFDMNAVVEEFETQIPSEFDFFREAEMMTTIRLNLRRAGITDVVIPKVIPGFVSRRALTMTFIDGCRADNSLALHMWGIDPKRIIKAIGRAYGQMFLCDGLAHCDPHLGNLIILRDQRVGLIDFGQAKEIPSDLRRKLCAFYLALGSRNNLYIMKTFGDLGIELDIEVEDIDEEFIEMIPVYANGMLDTAPLPADVEMNPFSEESPLKKVGIKKFNPDLFMILRTMGLLRSLTQTLNVDGVDCWMSSLFQPYARRGLRMREASEAEKRKRKERIRSSLISGVCSPFDDGDGMCAMS